MRLGPWELREVIGVGGMGEVWSATRGDGMYEGRAAVKLLRLAHDRSDIADLLIARFAREGELLARLTHPHIAQLLDAGVTAEDTRYLVLEFVQGQRIDHWCDARRLSVKARLRLLLQVCEAVAFAHANLIVHRDLKPANILVTDAAQVKLLDFGVAKLLAEAPGAEELTRIGAAGMTPEYAAPQQINGEAVTVATDVYALGVLMHVLLSGRRPYGGPGSTPVQLARDIIEAEPRRLGAAVASVVASGDTRTDMNPLALTRSTTAPRLRQQLAGDLEQIAAKALRKQPAERYASVRALADDIRRHLRHEPVSAQAPTFTYQARKFVRRHQGLTAAGALVMLTVSAGVAATLWQARLAREQAGVARTEAANATAIKDFMLGVFRTARVGDGKTTQDTSARELLKTGGEQLLQDKQLAPAVRLELLTVIGSLQNNLGQIDAADPLEREALRVAREVYGPKSEHYVHALVERGLTLTQLGRPQESDQLTGKAILIIESTGRQAGEFYPIALRQLGANAMQAGDMAAEVDYLKRSTLAFEAHQPQHPMRAIAHRWLGKAYTTLDDFPAAERELRRSITLSPGQAEWRDFGVALGRFSLGELFVRAGRFEAAGTELEQSLAITEATLGPRHRAAALVHGVLGIAQYQLGRAEASHASLAAALDIARSDTSRQVGNAMDRTHIALAQVALGDGRAAEALVHARAAAQRWQPSSGAPWAALLVMQAEAESLLGQPAEAVQALQQALPVIGAKLGASGLSACEARLALGEALERRRNAAEEARLAYATVLAPGADEAASASPTRSTLMARATLGMARLALADDFARSARLAREAQALAYQPAPARRERPLLAQARIVEAQALAAMGQAGAARASISQAVDIIASLQSPDSPRLAEARLALAALER